MKIYKTLNMQLPCKPDHPLNDRLACAGELSLAPWLCNHGDVERPLEEFRIRSSGVWFVAVHKRDRMQC